MVKIYYYAVRRVDGHEKIVFFGTTGSKTDQSLV